MRVLYNNKLISIIMEALDTFWDILLLGIILGLVGSLFS